MARPTVPEVEPLVRALYATKDGGAGCCLHIVLDDGNADDSSVLYCYEHAIRAGHAKCALLAGLLARMSMTQRRKLGNLTGLIPTRSYT